MLRPLRRAENVLGTRGPGEAFENGGEDHGVGATPRQWASICCRSSRTHATSKLVHAIFFERVCVSSDTNR